MNDHPDRFDAARSSESSVNLLPMHDARTLIEDARARRLVPAGSDIRRLKRSRGAKDGPWHAVRATIVRPGQTYDEGTAAGGENRADVTPSVRWMTDLAIRSRRGDRVTTRTREIGHP